MDWSRKVNIKNSSEIAIMREAGRINATVHAAVRDLLQPGVSTADLDAAAEDVLKKFGVVSPFKGYGHPPFPNSIFVCFTCFLEIRIQITLIGFEVHLIRIFLTPSGFLVPVVGIEILVFTFEACNNKAPYGALFA